ncbi:hypothetical protein Barb4_04489 [Bacteroidales bacterium Barb4]|nr:hypothetical protein Barb4_04489 [Bacteroidales bacterium Barb4]
MPFSNSNNSRKTFNRVSLNGVLFLTTEARRTRVFYSLSPCSPCLCGERCLVFNHRDTEDTVFFILYLRVLRASVVK